MEFTHSSQLKHLDVLKRQVSSPLEYQMLTDIQNSVIDSKNHLKISGGMIQITMNAGRYKKFMKLVVSAERDEGPEFGNEVASETIQELQMA